jgi:hypothetical protein
LRVSFSAKPFNRLNSLRQLDCRAASSYNVSFSDAIETLGEVENISKTFVEFQKHLYERKVA